MFWIWNAFTYYSERFESEGLDNRVFTFLAMLAVAGLAVWGTDGLGHDYLGFALSYAAARLLNIGMWLRDGAGHRQLRFSRHAFWRSRFRQVTELSSGSARFDKRKVR